MRQLSRSLSNDQEVKLFVENILDITEKQEKREAINSICKAELGLKAYIQHPTLTSDNYRDYEYSDDDTREDLRKKIFKELVTIERPEKDDDIQLGAGGALPRQGNIKCGKRAYIIIGPPASGKSGVSSKLADLTGSVILDSDYAKRKFPEFYNKDGGATLVHDESDALVFSYKKFNMLEYCVENSYNIIIPKIGHNKASIIEIATALKSRGYELALILIDLDRIKATQRAYLRFRDSKRYVPLSLIFDSYANDPILNYYRIKQTNTNLFSGFAQIDTDVPKDENPNILESEGLEEISNLFM